jgi:hypothetical protein
VKILLTKLTRRFLFQNIGFLLAGGSLFVLPDFCQSAFNGFQMEPHAIPLEEIEAGGPPKDGIPALTNPKFLPADQVDLLSNRDRILGVRGKKQAKAYPISILNWHEIVNDTLDGLPILVSYCPLCGSGIGFLRRVDGQILTFGVSGLLYQSDVLMYDHQTESLWSQMSMQAVTGQAMGKTLEPIFLENTTWEAWRRQHPDTLVLSTDTGFARNYRKDPYADYAMSDDVMFPIKNKNNRFPPKEWVLGIEVKEKYKAYPFSIMEKTAHSFADAFNDEDYVVCWDSSNRSAKVVDHQGVPMPATLSYWFAWYTFHPDTEVLIGNSGQSPKAQKNLAVLCE